MSGGGDRKTLFPALVVAGGILLYMAPATFALATEFTQSGDQCDAHHEPLSVRDSVRLAELSIDLMNDPTGGDCLLASYGMTREGYVDLMADVSTDRELSAEYNTAFERLKN